MADALQVIAAFFLADLASAVFHLVTDRGCGLPIMVRWFLKHHDAPETMTFDLMPAIVGLPIFVAGLFTLPWLLCSFGLFLSFAQIPHYYVHHPAPAIVRFLQRSRVFLRPAAHLSHHRSFDRDFAVLNGMSNPLVNWLARYVPARRAV
jgi:hypothetical protein